MTGERLGWREYLLLALVALALLAPGIASIPPVDRDESRYATASVQMMTSGDYVDIRFLDQPRYLQPVGSYWLQSAAVSVLSSPEAKAIWAHRVPSLLAAIAAVLMSGWIATFLFGRKAGLAAAVLLAACFSLGFEARSAKTDAVLLASIVVAQLSMMRIYLDPAGPKRRAAVFWVAVGAGMLIKGPIILIVTGSTLLALLAWDRKAGWMKGLHVLWGLPLMLAVVLPWYVAIGMVSDGDFYARAVGKNLLGKVGSSQQSHAGPPGYHLALYTLAFWPASLFAAFAAPFAWRNRAEPGVRFLIAWIVPTWVIFELVATKLPHYVLPTYPALAALAGAALFAPAVASPKWVKALGGVYALLWLVVSAVLAALAPVAMWQLEGEVWPLAVGVASAAFVLSCAGLWFVLNRRQLQAVASVAMAALLVWINTYAGILPRLDSFWLSPKIIAAVDAAAPCPDPILVSTPYHEPSMVFLHGPARTTLPATPEKTADVLAADPACTLALVGAGQKDAFLRRTAELGLPVRPAGSVKGTNYSDNNDLDLTIYVAARR